jgi:AraC-like DNA-binding protein
MKFHKKYPVVSLSPFVRHYWYFEIDEDDLPFSQLSFPYGSFELICYLENPNVMRWINTADDFLEPDIFYAGQLTKPFVMTFEKKCICIGASLQPWAGDHLYSIPSDEFTNELTPLDRLDTNIEFYGQLKLCTDINALFNCMEKYLLERLCKKQNDPLSSLLAKRIINEPTRDALNHSLRDIGLSRRRIEQRFIHSTGLSMGAFMRKVRFQKTIHLLSEGYADLSLVEIGLKAGYYDQAHFINDFKAFSGLSPKNFCGKTTGLKDFFKTIVPVN